MKADAVRQARRVLTPWFGGTPLGFAIPNEVQTVGVKFAPFVRPVDWDRDSWEWEHHYSPYYRALAQLAARQGTALFGSQWSLTYDDQADMLMIAVVTDPDPAKLFEAVEKLG